MHHFPTQKPYKMKWLDAERELALRGFLLPPIPSSTSPRLQPDKPFPATFPPLPKKL